MKIVEIRSEAGWQQLRDGWEVLLRDSASATIFLTWEWTSAWWPAYGAPGELYILAAYDGDGALRGIAPMRRRTMRGYGQTVPTLTFLADGSNDSDYLDFLIAAGYERLVMEAFCRHWQDALRSGTVLEVNEIPESSPNLPALRAWAESDGCVWRETEVLCGTVCLPGTWDVYLGMLKPRFRTKVRSTLRKLQERGEARFGFAQTLEEANNLLPVLYDLHSRRWAADGKSGVFGWDRKRAFYSALTENLLASGRLRFSWLEWKGRILACQYGFVYGDTYFQLQEGYEPEAEHWNVGIGLRAWSIRKLLEQGIREYDFMAGMGRHKTDWGAEAKHSRRILCGRISHRNVLYCHGPRWESRAREVVNQFVPEHILARRRCPQGTEPPGSANGHPRNEWARNALARCYFHSPLPKLVQPMRERYQLSIATNDGRRFAFEKRREPAARILVFHRVNDDRDPFFPSLPTANFARQMSFVSRHYRVVSLAEVVDRLEAGSRNPVLAVTFDDGYQDNWEKAFPILQRYGLPATIFLATEAIDSREPLWFERLSLAVKKTRRDYLDLEFETPQRFWLRTQAERLDANSRLQGMLRRVADETRRCRLAEVLRLLEAGNCGDRNGKMLTWEQVRRMKASGIDFGGHTVTHPFISKLAKERAEWELSRCKRRIEEELQRPVDYFAYPSGTNEDIAVWSKDLVRSAGYRAAVTSIWGVNDGSTDRMELRRGQPWEEDPAVFAYKLDWYSLVNG
jgi:peptidoglycan/xylan/chitin deacetylase (PgdA/CDA1 family)/CelD/BcsL family acetyltransferase involved in cellulose biosynthesis